MLVLVYGSLREGGALNDNMAGANKLGTTWVRGRMHQASGWYPAVVIEDIPENEKVLCEAYEIDEDKLALLDAIEGHPNFYERVQVETEYGDAWIYTWHPDQINNHRVVESGDWITEWTAEA